MSQTEKLAKWLVVGGDGLIGSHLAGLSGKGSPQVVMTTRRKPVEDGRLFANLSTGDVTQVTAAGADIVFLCAAMTNMQACQQDQELSYRINVTGTVDLTSRLVRQGSFVVFLSSNTVFNGLINRPDEDAACAPVNEYGRQKVEAEKQLLAIPGADKNISIVRLSKTLSPHSGMVAEFLRCFLTGEICQAFNDLKMSPISLGYVSRALSIIASRKLPGVFHLSGEEEMSYAEFASRLAMNVGANP